MDSIPKKKSTHVWMDAREVTSTEKAFLLEIDGEEVWIPRKAIGARKKNIHGKIERVEMVMKVAKDKGLV